MTLLYWGTPSNGILPGTVACLGGPVHLRVPTEQAEQHEHAVRLLADSCKALPPTVDYVMEWFAAQGAAAWEDFNPPLFAVHALPVEWSPDSVSPIETLPVEPSPAGPTPPPPAEAPPANTPAPAATATGEQSEEDFLNWIKTATEEQLNELDDEKLATAAGLIGADLENVSERADIIAAIQLAIESEAKQEEV